MVDVILWVIDNIEKGLVTIPGDPGGVTNYGISQRAYPELDIPNLTKGEAHAIYYRDYYVPSGASDAPCAFSLVLFDGAVNQGVHTAVKLLQGLLEVKQDGLFGPATKKAMSHFDEVDLINQYLSARLTAYRGLRNWPRFGRGWTNRLSAIRREAYNILEMEDA